MAEHDDRFYLVSSGPAYRDKKTGEIVEPKVLIHLCHEPGCNEWGSLGLDAGGTRRGTWWCHAHYPRGHRKPSLTPPPQDVPVAPTTETENDPTRDGDSDLFDGA